MKNLTTEARIFTAVAALVLLVAACPVFAITAVRANVPFDFVAFDHKLPAGHYMLQRAISGNHIVLTNLDQSSTIMLPVLRSGNVSSAKSPRLVFERTGDSYRLTDVKMAGTPSDSVPQTKKSTLVAANGAPQVIEVALE